jgi:hypothetical protein
MVKCVYCGREFKNNLAYSMHKCEGFLKEKEQKKQQREKAIEKYEYICECGKKFETASSLRVHARFCNKHIPKKKPSIYKHGLIYICECGREFENSQAFNSHLGHCEVHHTAVGTARKRCASEIRHSMCWENKTDDEIKEIHSKSGKAYSENQKSGKTKNVWLGKEHSAKSKQHHREAAIKYRNELASGIKASYNKNGCKYIDKLNEQYNWHLQHAENGGEVVICGYYLDGYDKDLNIVFEYDERRHYSDVYNNILNKKDIERQNEIINELHCDFYRYNETLDLFYKVN